MIPFNIVLAFLLLLPINSLSYPAGYNCVVAWRLMIVPIVAIAKIIDRIFSIHLKLLACMYRNNHRILFKILVYLILHFDDSLSCLRTQFLLNACMWHALSKDDDALLLFLLKCGADPNIVYRETTRILSYPYIYDSIEYKNNYPDRGLLAEACQKDNTTLAIMLLQHHADPDCNVLYYNYSIMGDCEAYFPSRIDDCRNPLLIACHNNNSKIIKELIRYGTKTHPFIDKMRMQLTNTSIINMGDRSTILQDSMNSLREINVSPIGFTLCHKNRDLFNLLTLYTLMKNESLPTSCFFTHFVLFGQQENSLLQLLLKDIKKIIWSNINCLMIDKNSIQACFVCKEPTWSKCHDGKISRIIDRKEIKYWKNKLEIARFYSSPKLTNSHNNSN